MAKDAAGPVWIHRRMRETWLRYDDRWHLIDLIVLGDGKTEECWAKKRLSWRSEMTGGMGCQPQKRRAAGPW